MRLGTNPSAVKRLLASGMNALDVELASAALATLGLKITIDAGGLGLAARAGQRDAVHAWSCAYVVRHLRRLGFEVRTEVEIGSDRSRGWIDILAYRAADRILLCIEVKTQIDDAGRILRNLGWNARNARAAGARFGWMPVAIVPALFVLFTTETEERLAAAQDLIANHLPGTADAMIESLVVAPAVVAPASRLDPTIALIDPRRRGRRWLIRPRIQGGRSRPAFDDYADAANSMRRRRRPG